MLGNTLKKVTWMARATTTIVGVAIMLALVFGVATTALAGTGIGATFNLGKTNTVNAVSKLVGSVVGPSLQIDNNSAEFGATALRLEVEPGRPPMTVSSDAKVVNLNADRLDNREVSQIGVNGLQQVNSTSALNSDSHKDTIAKCPTGKVVVGTGYDIIGAKKGSFPNFEADVVIDVIRPASASVFVEAFEEEPTSADWSVTATAICATAP